MQEGPTDILGVLANVSRAEHEPHVRRVGQRASAFAHAHLNAHARECYWRALLHAYARRLAAPPSLAHWPRARPARPAAGTRPSPGSFDGWYPPTSPRGRPLLDWRRVPDGWRVRDDASLTSFVEELEARAAASRDAADGAESALPEAVTHGTASLWHDGAETQR